MQAKFTTKGQIVIPALLRRKYGIRKGTKVRIEDDDGQLVLRPETLQARKALLKQLRGSLKGSGALQTLMEERARDREREDAGWTPPSL